MIKHKADNSRETYHKVKTAIWKINIAFGLTCLLSALFLLLIGVYQINQAYERFGPVVAPSRAEPWSLSASTTFFVGFLLLTLGFSSRRYGITITQTGLIFHRPFLSDYPLSFSGISGVAFLQENSTLLAKWRGSYAYLWLEDGRRVSIGKYISSSVIPDVITRIKAEIYPELEARFRKSLSIGQTVQFGSILINKSGLTMHNHSIPWNDVKRLSIDHGRLQLETIPNKTMRIDVLKLPNVEILLLLIREMEQL